MRRNKRYFQIVWMIVLLFTFTQCKKEAVVPVVVDPGTTTGTTIPAATELNNFVWSSMNDLYLWNAQVPNLINTYYQPLTTASPNYKRNVDSLNVFLNKYKDPSTLFNSLLYQYGTVDKWSFIVNDYTIIENWIAGISKTMGYDYQLYRLNSTSDAVYGVIRYVYPGSPAELAGIKRGNIFIKIDGTALTISNYQALIAKETFALTLASIANGTLTQSAVTPVMTAVQMQENPIFLSKVINVNGSKVGYLVYNGFNAEYDLALNTVFGQFKSAGITKLILDLRYNGGGSVRTAIYLGSMIYTTSTSKVFSKSVWNSLNSNYNGSDSFTGKIVSSSTSSTDINSLGLSDIYFIVSGETASASEMLINGLKPYMNVRTIGVNTYGKYVASVTLYDFALDSKGNLIPDGKGGYVRVSTHKYAMQPIIAKYANSLGVSDFVTGLAPDFTAKEDVGNMLPLGDENETLLKEVLDYMKAGKSISLPNPTALANAKALFGTKDKSQFSHDMYVDPSKMVRRTK